jgi:penicillin-binding protein-related factor A (putative recombinase)
MMKQPDFSGLSLPGSGPAKARAHFFRNTGKPFEIQISNIASLYEQRNLLSLEKVDPPVRVIGTGTNRKVIFQKNPHLDFVGVWTERGGRALFMEAKSTDDERLPLNAEGGIRDAQVKALQRWHRCGAAVGILWECRGKVRFISYERVRRALAQNFKSFAIDETVPVKQGNGFIIYDFIENLRAAYPAT